MQTATEVGGDYYDYCEAEDGSLVMAIGDATGHGSKAGYFVATTKSYFQSNVCRASLLELMHSISQGLRNMNLRGMFMALMTLRLRDRTIILCNGGMPQPLLLKKDGSIEIIDTKALPLGAVRSAKYEEVSRELETGDALVLVSDGVTERFSSEQELFGLERLCEVCRLAALECTSAEELIKAIIAANDTWAKESDGTITLPHDDVTVVVIRAR
jgi:serine phosphatase RsbU (regulator of sigma subunit)